MSEANEVTFELHGPDDDGLFWATCPELGWESPSHETRETAELFFLLMMNELLFDKVNVLDLTGGPD